MDDNSLNMNWRLIYNETTVIDLFETNDVTLTPYKVYESKNIEDCFKIIDSDKLFFIYYLSETESILFENGIRTIVNN